MSYLLPHLHSGYAVDQAILSEEDRVVVIRFGHDWDPVCMQARRAAAAGGGVGARGLGR
jgi:DIM1 family U5 snRNP protein